MRSGKKTIHQTSLGDALHDAMPDDRTHVTQIEAKILNRGIYSIQNKTFVSENLCHVEKLQLNHTNISKGRTINDLGGASGREFALSFFFLGN